MLKVKPLAFDSFGVRSMATFVETDDVAVLIDPSVSLAPKRYKLPPHPVEEQRMSETWADIKETAVKTILVEHHFMRDLKYKERIAEVYEYAAEKEVKVMSAAEYLGGEVEMLEARRRELYASKSTTL